MGQHKSKDSWSESDAAVGFCCEERNLKKVLEGSDKKVERTRRTRPRKMQSFSPASGGIAGFDLIFRTTPNSEMAQSSQLNTSKSVADMYSLRDSGLSGKKPQLGKSATSIQKIPPGEVRAFSDKEQELLNLAVIEASKVLKVKSPGFLTVQVSSTFYAYTWFFCAEKISKL